MEYFILYFLISQQLLNYQPGDHVGVCPKNRTELVDGILERLTGVGNFDEPLQLQILNEQQTIHGNSTPIHKILYPQNLI
jgi:sulfite reductase alpha subunit-like flavoprotein